MKMQANKVIYIVVLFLLVSCNNSNRKSFTMKENQQFKENLVKANKGLLSVDNDRIKAYVNRRKWNMQITETGLWYEIYEKGTGEKAKKGDVVRINYTVSLLDGTFCYSSDSTGAMDVKINHSNIETGLDQALLMMGEGDKGRFIMPPHLAHGLLGDDNKIPPRSIIVYHAELLKLDNY